MNEYLSAAELAQLNILSLPKTPKGISDKAKRECWPSRKRAQRGGGITDAVDFVVRQVESGQLSETLAYLVPVANARANNQRGISVRTLKGWVAAYRAAGSPNARLAALAPRPTKTETPVVQIAWLADLNRWANCLTN